MKGLGGGGRIKPESHKLLEGAQETIYLVSFALHVRNLMLER